MSNLLLRYASPAENSDEGWEKYSMPIGNSYLGANIFGIVERERVQITENATENPGELGGLNSFADIYIEFPHDNVCAYERGLDLNKSLAYCHYDCENVRYTREYFASYPDRALVMRFTASEKGRLSFTLAPEISFLTDDETRRKTGEVISDGNQIILRGVMEAYNVRFEGQLRLFNDGGQISAHEGRLTVENADSAYIVFVCATNYELSPSIFLENDRKKKLRDFDPHEKCTTFMENAVKYNYDELYAHHFDDYNAIFGRVSLDIGDMSVPTDMTDELLKKYSEGEKSHYLEVLYFQYGRYLLISSSRKGALPANLQGVWNCHDRSPWGAGYWHNINVQMNYWPAFVANIAETFDAYLDYYLAFRPAAEKFARNFIKSAVPENYIGDDADYGWTIGTGNYSYTISGPGGHSGPGTGGLTSKLFWDYYDFSRDDKALREVAYPALLSMAHFLTKVVCDYNGLYLSKFSASPEQLIDNKWVKPVLYYQTVGCAFDQQMIYENGRDLLRCVDIIGEENLSEADRATIATLREQIDHYDPIQIGWSGQIKEYREENFYGEIGEYRHRHISQLVGLYPGTIVNAETPAWNDAAKVTLNERGDLSTGWALAHRLNAWARTGDGERAYTLLSNLIGTHTLPNLWDFHPPFQIDGNFGGTSGIAELLIQSHGAYIEPLASLPSAWESGEYSGLCARGGFELSVKWSMSSATEIRVKSKAGLECAISYEGIADAKLNFDAAEIIDRNHIKFHTEKGGEYVISDIPTRFKMEEPKSLTVTKSLELSWEHDGAVNIWRAVDGEPCYALIAQNIKGGAYKDISCDFSKHEIITYKVTRCDDYNASKGSFATVNHATKLEYDRYKAIVQQINAACGGANPKIV